MNTQSELLLTDIDKSFKVEKKDIKVLEKISLKVKKGEFNCIIGPNGCGKTSLIKIIAGIEKPSNGLYKKPPVVAYLPQQSSLLPWFTLKENIELPGRINKILDKKLQNKINQYLKKYKLDKFTDFYPGEISGGMKQKAALIRTVVYRPPVIILDEPFSALDAITRIEMQQMLVDLWLEYKPTILCVTHDIDEAIYLSDKIFVMSKRPGRIVNTFNVNIDRPRTLDNLSSKSQIKLKKDLRKLLLP